MRRLAIVMLGAILLNGCGLPPDIVGPTDPRNGPPEQPPNRG